MKKLTTILSIAALIVGIVTGCQPSKTKDGKSETSVSKDSASSEQMAKGQYTCSMHPEVVAGGPGKCPKCGMDLGQGI